MIDWLPSSVAIKAQVFLPARLYRQTLTGRDALPIIRELIGAQRISARSTISRSCSGGQSSQRRSYCDGVLTLVAKPDARSHQLVQQFLIERLARRYMMAGGEADLRACARSWN